MIRTKLRHHIDKAVMAFAAGKCSVIEPCNASLLLLRLLTNTDVTSFAFTVRRRIGGQTSVRRELQASLFQRRPLLPNLCIKSQSVRTVFVDCCLHQTGTFSPGVTP